MTTQALTTRTLACLALGIATSVWGQPPATFDASKKLLAAIHEDIGHLETVYCACPYTRKGASGGDIDRDACGLAARKNDTRSDRVEWEHVVPASWFGRDRQCWTHGHASCVRRSGAAFKGRDCCTRRGVDPDFLAAHNDPHNLFPSGGEVNGDRSNHPFGTVAGESRLYGSCDFEVGGTPKVAEPADGVRGEIARAMLYMNERYRADVQFAREELLRWHRADPPDRWETVRAERIEMETGLRNHYIVSP